jgi:activator of HSP90 ATPase
MILGKNLALVPNRMIVQAWRSSQWKAADPDSILVVQFEKSAGGTGTVTLAHIGVPQYDHKGVTQGWKNYYWKPWKDYFKTRNK